MSTTLKSVFLFAALFVVIGCSEKAEPVATTQDEFAAYDALIAEDQAQTAADEADNGE